VETRRRDGSVTHHRHQHTGPANAPVHVPILARDPSARHRSVTSSPPPSYPSPSASVPRPNSTRKTSLVLFRHSVTSPISNQPRRPRNTELPIHIVSGKDSPCAQTGGPSQAFLRCCLVCSIVVCCRFGHTGRRRHCTLPGHFFSPTQAPSLTHFL
jgi:hypothetical protein